ncbi:MAG: DUF3999 domain-containing protein [Bradymonadaceae bacterium]|nr:DUF3999 domain-containing protein [Lujinxingiaceae bacterium]
MSSPSKRFLLVVLTPVIVLGSMQSALAADDTYGWQWPLALSRDDGGAYRVVVNAELYEHTTRADLGDLDVRNAAGQTVPTAVLGPEAPLAAIAQRVELPLFELPPNYRSHHSWSISHETHSRGQIRRVDSEHSYFSSGPSVGVLLDASRVLEPIRALEMQWPDAQPGEPSALDFAVTVETSSDLVEWRTVLERGQLVDLQNDGERVLQNRLELRGASRYLRVLPRDPANSVRFVRASAVLEPARAEAVWEWKTLTGVSQAADGHTTVTYESPGRYPVARADLVLASNSATEWRLESRDSESQPWRNRAGPWIGFQVRGDVETRSAAQNLASPSRDRLWRLVSTAPTRDLPQLKLGYRPELVVFLAQDEGPFTLVAGSTTTTRTEAPLDRLVATLRAHHGAHWAPLPAYLGAVEELGGEQAIRRPADETSPAWTTWLLWIVLAGGSALVAGLAVYMLRQPQA